MNEMPTTAFQPHAIDATDRPAESRALLPLSKAQLPIIKLPLPPLGRAGWIEAVRLYQQVARTLATKACPMVQFVSAFGGEGSHEVARNMAWAGAAMLAKRVLYVEASPEAADGRSQVGALLAKRLEDVVRHEASWDQAVARVANLPLFATVLQNESDFSHGLVDPSILTTDDKGALDSLRSVFDMIVIAAPPADVGPSCVVLSGLVDASIIVVEAERTRAPDAERLRDLLASTGGPVIGAVLNRQRRYVPGFLRRWL